MVQKLRFCTHFLIIFWSKNEQVFVPKTSSFYIKDIKTKQDTLGILLKRRFLTFVSVQNQLVLFGRHFLFFKSEMPNRSSTGLDSKNKHACF